MSQNSRLLGEHLLEECHKQNEWSSEDSRVDCDTDYIDGEESFPLFRRGSVEFFLIPLRRVIR
jgi:hypothetical protein